MSALSTLESRRIYASQDLMVAAHNKTRPRESFANKAKASHEILSARRHFDALGGTRPAVTTPGSEPFHCAVVTISMDEKTQRSAFRRLLHTKRVPGILGNLP